MYQFIYLTICDLHFQVLYRNVWPTTRLTQNNITLLAIVLIIPNGIEESLTRWPGSRHCFQEWIQSRILTQVQPRVVHYRPLDTCFAKSSDSGPTWIPFLCLKRDFSGYLKLCSWGLHSLLPHQTSMGLFFFFKTLNALLKICIHNTFPTQQYKTVQSLL